MAKAASARAQRATIHVENLSELKDIRIAAFERMNAEKDPAKKAERQNNVAAFDERIAQEMSALGVGKSPSEKELSASPVTRDNYKSYGGKGSLAEKAVQGKINKVDFVKAKQFEGLDSGRTLSINSASDDYDGHVRFVAGVPEPFQGSIDLSEAETKDTANVQTVIISKDKFKDLDAAKKWLGEHGFHFGKIDDTGGAWRFRQKEPEQFGQKTFRTIDMADGVKAVIGKLYESEAPKTGKLWEVVVIESGMSKNGRLYPPETLQKAVPLFEDLNVFIHKFEPELYDHLPDKVRSSYPEGVAGNLVGYLQKARYEEVDGKGCIVADLHLVDENLREVFKNLWDTGRLDKLGFSIDVEGTVADGPSIHGVPTKRVESIDKAYALDVVTYPAAGGRMRRLKASDTKGDVPMNKKMLEFIRAFAPQVLEGVGVPDSLTEAQLIAPMSKAVEALQAKMKAQPCAESHVCEAAADLLKQAIEALKANDSAKAMEALQMALEALGDKAGPYREPSSQTAQVPVPAPAPVVVVPAPVQASATPPAPVPAPVVPPVRASESVDPKAFKDLTTQVENQGKALQESRVRESQAVMRAKLVESNLPMAMRERLSKEMAGQVLTVEQIDVKITEAKDLLAKLSESGNIVGMGTPGGTVKPGMSESERIQLAVDLLVDPDLARLKESKDKYAGIRPFRGLREAWSFLTGDNDVRFDRRRFSPRMVEAVTTDLPKIFGDSITRHMLRTYKGFPDHWRKAVTTRPLNDFRTQRAIQWGAFNDLAIVAQNGAFTAFTTPTEREETYTPQKRGRSYQITREMILGDDLRALRQIGPGIARAAIRTLNKFVFNVLVGNAGGGGINTDVLADAVAIYAVARANLGTDALDADSLRAARVRMMLQQDESAQETLGLGMGEMKPILWVPLQELPKAQVLVNSEQKPGSANNDINDNFKSAEPIGVPYLGDVNNWYLQARQEELESIELGFVEGEEDPVILVQDDPLLGDVFTNERITYKVRHEYGGVVTNPRGLDGSIVP